MSCCNTVSLLMLAVNEIFGDRNVEKQMTDSRGDVSYHTEER